MPHKEIRPDTSSYILSIGLLWNCYLILKLTVHKLLSISYNRLSKQAIHNIPCLLTELELKIHVGI